MNMENAPEITRIDSKTIRRRGVPETHRIANRKTEKEGVILSRTNGRGCRIFHYERKGRNDLTGGQLQDYVFGETEIPSKHSLWIEACENARKRKEDDIKKGVEDKNKKYWPYLPYNKAMRLAEASQKTSQTGNNGFILKQVCEKIAEILLNDKSRSCLIERYSALETPLDHWHGVDGFIRINNVVVTFDASKHPSKGEDGIKADIFIGEFPDPDDEKEKDLYKEYIKSIAMATVSLIRERAKFVIRGGNYECV